ncbi:hypothetical protein DFH05DRAFT_1496281 [Lentinula detonsa]|uniref:Uncharacterized protein n=1 Tax=Lentinula detonsa TaxID=2804962 RepID=A0A9W8NYQ7_9AGAR|nr:hypothetical protein DFH05DRAFT_1496281 [Lentinula detonsa]
MNSMMGSQNDEPGMLEVLSRALKESQNSTTRLQTELNIALEKSKELEKENARLRADVVQLSDTKNLKLEHVDTQVPVMSDEVCRLTESNNELKETITALNVKAEEAQGELKAAQEHLAQFSTKYAQLRQKKKDLNEELHAATDRVAELELAITDLHDKYVKSKQLRKEIQLELKNAKEQQNAKKQHESWQLMKEDSLKIHNKIKTLAFQLPLFRARPNFTNLLPIAKDIDIDILEFLKIKAPSYHWNDQSVFYVPTGLVLSARSSQHYLKYSPVSAVLSDSDFQVEPAYKSRDPEIRELITHGHKGVIYLGLYKRFVPDCVASTTAGMILPDLMSDQLSSLSEEIYRTAHSAGSLAGLPTTEKLQALFLDGTLKVQCSIYQCIGFNQDLYRTLTQENKPEAKRKKPGMDEEEHVERGSPKKPRGVPSIKKSSGQRARPSKMR